MYIEDNAADKKEKVGEEGKINPFMNIVDWEKLVKYLSLSHFYHNDKSVRGTMTEEGTNFRMKNASPPSAHSLRPVCIL